ncbi:4'-phosphopantetheinyl transferase family protein [Pseudomonas sp. GCM10022188]|uniref:4'-phosphopantetheinyl transferase family protein n=1 Tax=Pseudomonas TaxID=286 RepID=UPI001E30DDCE|nr:4'-phosphopantetheinyl transferase superfamily protein [Pseudomonas oryzagri]MCC6074283.1 4'-phosphopantetheinyl transferase superfamily protein [Pseudomonas oryzagri]
MQDTTRLEASGRWPADIAIWQVRLPAQADARDWPGLTADECERAARFRLPAERIRFAVTRSRLRQLLGDYRNTPPAALRFTHNAWGRPELVDGAGLSFNVSHSAGQALIAVSATRRVGVDVEWIDPALDWRGLTGLLCTPDERQAIEGAPPGARRRAFFRCWTAKEALLKAQGQGLAAGLRSLNLAPAGLQAQDEAGSCTLEGGGRLHYRWLEDLAGYGACLAYGEAGSAGA